MFKSKYLWTDPFSLRANSVDYFFMLLCTQEAADLREAAIRHSDKNFLKIYIKYNDSAKQIWMIDNYEVVLSTFTRMMNVDQMNEKLNAHIFNVSLKKYVNDENLLICRVLYSNRGIINGNDISVVLDHLNVFFKYSEKRDIFFRIDNLTT